jgi:cysteine desulfurase
LIYFDHNATHPLLPSARDAWLSAFDEYIGNPSSPHRLGSRADRALNDSREQLAHYIGCDPSEIVWTSGATEANNTVVAHLAAASKGVALGFVDRASVRACCGAPVFCESVRTHPRHSGWRNRSPMAAGCGEANGSGLRHRDGRE